MNKPFRKQPMKYKTSKQETKKKFQVSIQFNDFFFIIQKFYHQKYSPCNVFNYL